MRKTGYFLRWLLVFVVGVGGLFMVPSSAAGSTAPAINVCDPIQSPDPEMPDSGITGMMMTPQRVDYIQDQVQSERASTGDNWAPYMSRGMAGTQWHTIVTNSCMDPRRGAAMVAMADGIWSLSRFLASFAIFSHQTAASGEVLEWLSDFTVEMVEYIRDDLWAPLLPTMTIIGAITLAWWGLGRKRATMSMEGAVWMIIAVTLALLIFGNPRWTLDTATDFTTTGSDLIHNVVSPDSETIDRCPPAGARLELQDNDDPDHVTPEDNPTEGGEPPEFDGIWIQSQTMFNLLVCDPWMVGIFGDTAQHSEPAEYYAWQTYTSQGFNYREARTIREDRGHNAYQNRSDNMEHDYRAVSEQIYNFYPETFPAWSGLDMFHRLMTAFAALFSVIMGGALITAISIYIVVLQGMFMLMLIFAPIILLVGMHPSAKPMVGRFLEKWLGSMVTVLIMHLLMAVFLLMYSLISSLPISYFAKPFILVILMIALFKGRKALGSAISASAPGMMGRMVADGVNSRGLSRIHNATNPVVGGARAAKAGWKKAAPLVGQAVGMYVGGTAGGAVGRKVGDAASGGGARGQRQPEDAPPRDARPGDQARWSAQDVTPRGGRAAGTKGQLPGRGSGGGPRGGGGSGGGPSGSPDRLPSGGSGSGGSGGQARSLPSPSGAGSTGGSGGGSAAPPPSSGAPSTTSSSSGGGGALSGRVVRGPKKPAPQVQPPTQAPPPQRAVQITGSRLKYSRPLRDAGSAPNLRNGK